MRVNGVSVCYERECLRLMGPATILYDGVPVMFVIIENGHALISANGINQGVIGGGEQIRPRFVERNLFYLFPHLGERILNDVAGLLLIPYVLKDEAINCI